MTNSADPDQLASSLFAKTGYVVFSKRRVNTSYHVSKFSYCSIKIYFHIQWNCGGHKLYGWKFYVQKSSTDDEFGFNNVSTHEGQLRQNGTLTYFSIERAVMLSYPKEQ